MPTFLIAEDDRQRRALLHDLLAKEFPAARVDEARNLAEAIALARETRGRGEHYDVALLDVNLPPDGSGRQGADVHPEVRGQLLKALTYATFVVNYSSVASDPRLRQEIDRLREPNAPAPVLIHASAGMNRNWPEAILRLCRRVVYGRRIAEQLDRLLRTDQFENGGVAARSQHGTERSTGTQALGDLARDVKLHWNDLDDELQRRIRSAFEITEVDGEVLVNL
ncbi:MAG: response regulator [Isosphaeraceae bacterium]